MGRTREQQRTIDALREKMQEIESSKQDKETKLSNLFNLYKETVESAGTLVVQSNATFQREEGVAFADAAGETAQVGMEIATAILRIDPEEGRKRFRTTLYKELSFK
jgi:hypothetical protein